MSLQQRILESIPTGRDNAIPQNDLWNRIGVPDRIGRKLINRMRAANYPIFSAGSGYYLPSDGDAGLREARQFIQTMSRQATSRLASVKVAKNYLKNNDAQLEFDFDR